MPLFFSNHNFQSGEQFSLCFSVVNFFVVSKGHHGAGVDSIRARRYNYVHRIWAKSTIFFILSYILAILGESLITLQNHQRLVDGG